MENLWNLLWHGDPIGFFGVAPFYIQPAVICFVPIDGDFVLLEESIDDVYCVVSPNIVDSIIINGK